LSSVDWQEFVEGLSLTEKTLRGDPADVYRRMDFSTRDQYRHLVELMARHSNSTEVQVAQSAIEFAAEAARRLGPENRSAHVGFFLVDQGLSALENKTKVR